MSTPPSNGGYPNNDPYGQGGYGQPDQGGFGQSGQPTNGQGQPTYGQGQPTYGQDQPTSVYPQAGQGGYQPDPYQQQYDAYTQPHQAQHPGEAAWPAQQPMDAHYAGSPAGPAGPGWGQEPPKSNKLPMIVGAALLVIGAIVATVLIVTHKSGSSNDNNAADKTTQSTEDTGSNDTGSEDTGSNDTGSNDTGSEDTGSNDTGGSGNGSLPADFPLPSSVSVDSGSTFCSGNSCVGSFKSDDPEGAYSDWVSTLEDAGYSISSKTITGSGSNAIWSIEADGPMKISVYFATEGAFISS